MSDLTPPLNELLKKKSKHTRVPPRKRAAIRDEFLKEAYRINDHILSLHQYLLSIRRAYLSTAPPPRHHRNNANPHGNPLDPSHATDVPTYLSNPSKDSVDASSKTLLRDLSASLTQLASAESVRRETSARLLQNKYNKGVLGRWAAGASGLEKNPEQLLEEGSLETLKLLRESVLWYLGKKLEEEGEVQRGMMERRLEREVERGRSVLYKVRAVGMDDLNVNAPEAEGKEGGGRGVFKTSGGLDTEDDSRRETEQQLSPEQLQLFASENQEMLKQYEDTLDQVRTAERSMLEISELQTQLVQNLDIQSENISQLVADSVSTTENVGGGNKQLKRATERKSTARLVFWASCGLCGFLVTWDLIF